MTAPETPAAAMRFAVLHDGAVLPPWQERCLEALAAVPSCRAVGRLSPAAAAIPRLQSLAPDFILCFSAAPLPAALLALPMHGVWRFHLGDWLTYRGLPEGYWEVFDGCAASAALLVRVQTDPDVVEVLREGWLRTDVLSVRRNQEALFARIATWPAEVCRQLLAGGTRGPVPGELRRGALPRPPPSALQRARLRVRVALRAAGVGFRSFFRHDQWNIGIVDQPIERFAAAGARAATAWLPPPRRGELRADPFGLEREGRPVILCEHFAYRSQVGRIVAIDAAGAAAAESPVHIGPTPPVHLSYPLVVEDGGRIFCMPESSAAGEIVLYELERYPDRWIRRATLVAGRGFVDATPFQHEGRWWLAASEVAAKGANSELHLWFAAALAGPWTAHPGNPVKIDVRSARPGGTPFRAGGFLYRPAQDCSSTYGARVVLNQVLTLTPTAFRETAAASVDPDRAGPYPRGLHTLSRFGGRTLIDGKRSVFAPAEFLRVLAHYLPGRRR